MSLQTFQFYLAFFLLFIWDHRSWLVILLIAIFAKWAWLERQKGKNWQYIILALISVVLIAFVFFKVGTWVVREVIF